jgi:hypothetical protein
MTNRVAGLGIGLAVMIACLPAAAQTPASKESEVTLVGCVELERDYRARKESGRGGVLGSGVGVGNEFVLSSAKPPQGRSRAAGAQAAAGDYELTGRLEKDFLRHVGRQVEVIGTIEKGEEIDRINVTLWHPVGDYCPGAK